ncbi:hypothetical protein ES705_49824 [subsurface metagenome]
MNAGTFLNTFFIANAIPFPISLTTARGTPYAFLILSRKGIKSSEFSEGSFVLSKTISVIPSNTLIK